MARNQYDDDGLLDENDDVRDDSRLVKDLRKQLEAEKKARQADQERLASLERAQRSNTLTEVLSSKGVNPKVAQFYPSDKETSPEAVEAWLSEYGDVFGAKPAPVEDTTPKDQVDPTDLGFDPTTQAAYRRLAMTSGSGQIPADKATEIARAIADAKSPEELTQALRRVAQ